MRLYVDCLGCILRRCVCYDVFPRDYNRWIDAWMFSAFILLCSEIDFNAFWTKTIYEILFYLVLCKEGFLDHVPWLHMTRLSSVNIDCLLRAVIHFVFIWNQVRKHCMYPWWLFPEARRLLWTVESGSGRFRPSQWSRSCDLCKACPSSMVECFWGHFFFLEPKHLRNKVDKTFSVVRLNFYSLKDTEPFLPTALTSCCYSLALIKAVLHWSALIFVLIETQ